MAAVKETVELREAECSEVSSQLEKKSEAESLLQLEVETLKTELARLREAEEVLQGRVVSCERRVSHLEEKVADLQEGRGKRTDSVSGVVLSRGS